MKIIIQTILVFIDLCKILIIIDIVLSWLPLFWIRFRPKFIRDLIDPIYYNINKIIPTVIWNIDFTPIILILFLEIARELIIKIF